MIETATDGTDITARYRETPDERQLIFERIVSDESLMAVIVQNREGYAMLKVRHTPDGDELERYYGFEMACDHAAELLAVSPDELPIPSEAEDMGM